MLFVNGVNEGQRGLADTDLNGPSPSSLLNPSVLFMLLLVHPGHAIVQWLAMSQRKEDIAYKVCPSVGNSIPIKVRLLLVAVGLPSLFSLLVPASLGLQGGLSQSWIPVHERPSLDLSGSLTTLTGKQVALQDLRGKATLINAWATWCGPCRLEMPYLSDLYRRLSREGLDVIAVSWEDAEAVQAFLKETSAAYPFALMLDPDRILQGRSGCQGFQPL